MYCSFMHSVTSQLIIAYLASECKYTASSCLVFLLAVIILSREERKDTEAR